MLEYSGKVAKKGDDGSDVRTLQKALTAIGYDLGRVDGKYGSDTEREVKELQEKAGLTADGIAGPDTFKALNAVIMQIESIGGLAPDVLKEGSEGAGVKKMQGILKRLGHTTSEPDGQFGSGTKTAVKAFQAAESLDDDGVAGHRTLAALNEEVIAWHEEAVIARAAQQKVAVQQKAAAAQVAGQKAAAAQQKATAAAKAPAAPEAKGFDAIAEKAAEGKPFAGGTFIPDEPAKGGLFGMFKRRKNRGARR